MLNKSRMPGSSESPADTSRTSPDRSDSVPARRSLRDRATRLRAGHRVLHIEVPEALFNKAKAQAYLSNLRFRDYIARLLDEAKPFPAGKPEEGRPATNTEPSDAPGVLPEP